MTLFRQGVLSVCTLLLLAVSGPALALQNFTGRVMKVELTYMPGRVQFTLDQGNTACPAGKVLIWQNSNVENNKVVYAALVTALAGGHQIKFYIDDDDQACIGRYIYLVPA